MAVFQNGITVNTVGIKNQGIPCKSVAYEPSGLNFESHIQVVGGKKVKDYAVQNNSAISGSVIRLKEVLSTTEMKSMFEQIYRNGVNNIAISVQLTDGSFKGNVKLDKPVKWEPTVMEEIVLIVDGDNLVSKI